MIGRPARRGLIGFPGAAKRRRARVLPAKIAAKSSDAGETRCTAAAAVASMVVVAAGSQRAPGAIVKCSRALVIRASIR